jgi:hypothetical protein
MILIRTPQNKTWMDCPQRESVDGTPCVGRMSSTTKDRPVLVRRLDKQATSRQGQRSRQSLFEFTSAQRLFRRCTAFFSTQCARHGSWHSATEGWPLHRNEEATSHPQNPQPARSIHPHMPCLQTSQPSCHPATSQQPTNQSRVVSGE